MSRERVEKIVYEVLVQAPVVALSAWVSMLLIGAMARIWDTGTWSYWTCVAVIVAYAFARSGVIALWREWRRG